MKNSSKSDLLAYHNYMQKIALILGANPATVDEDMTEVLQFEMMLANVGCSNTFDLNEYHNHLHLFFRLRYLRSNGMTQAPFTIRCRYLL